ncbi:MAG TPA: hypothetical protein VN457_02730, partial [Chlamydiales bacterium]|nr:hypothetical protein [Chlamydiales bacterium]
IENKEGKALLCWLAHYDSYGNILEETTAGDLTGKKTCAFSVNKLGEIESGHVEKYRKYFTYSDDDFHLKTSQSEDGGPTIKYHYKPYTDLIAAKFTYNGDFIAIREFFEYDADGVLIKNIIDDGISHEPEKLTNVTERRITRINPVKGHGGHGLGQPATITEYYLDLESGKEIELKERNFTYDFAGHVKKEEVSTSDGKTLFCLYYSYDDKGRLIKKIDAEGREFAYEYDDNNNKTGEELKNSGTYSSFRYDKANRLIEETKHAKDHTSLTTSYEYDFVSNKIASTDHFGNTTNYEYDDLNRLVKITLPEVVDENKKRYLSTITKKYDLFDNVIEETNANGHSTKYSYNSRKQVTEIFYPDGSTERFEYNLNGTLAYQWDKSGTKTSYCYDFLNRVIKTEVFDAEDHRLFKTTNTYNAFHLLSSTDPMSYTTTFTYDGAGRKIKVKKEEEKTTYKYDSLERLAIEKKWYGDKAEEHIATCYEYDNLDRPITIQVENGDGTLLRRNRVFYDIFGNKTKETSSISEKERSVVETKYDSRNLPTTIIDELGHITTISYNFFHHNSRGQKVLRKTTIDPLNNKTIEVFDVLGRLKYIERRNSRELLLSRSICIYDATGNKVKQVEKVIVNGSPTRNYVIQNRYDTLNRLIQEIEEPNTPEEKKTSYEHSPKGHLRTITKPDGTTIHHSYDALCRLVKMKSSDGTIAYHYEYDLNSNPIAITDAVNDIIHKRTYDPWKRIIKDSLWSDTQVKLSYDLF